MVFDAFFDSIFTPLLKIGIVPTIIVIAFVVSILMVYIYKWATDQKMMKELKDNIKKYQKDMKDNRKDPEKFMECSKKANKLNFQYMKHSLKPTLFTFIPILIIFGWMNANLYFDPLSPGDEFDVSVFVKDDFKGNISSVNIPEGIEIISNDAIKAEKEQAVFRFKAIKSGNYDLEFKAEDDDVFKEILITDTFKYENPVKEFNSGLITKIVVGHNRLEVLFGLSWLWTYIIFAVFFSMILRKILKVY